jgi:hypothetical protein
VKTGPGTTAKMELADGSVIIMGPNSSYIFPVNVCELMGSSNLNFGSIWIKVKKIIGGGKFEVSAPVCAVGVRGTEFTVEIKEENGIKFDITKVYEGSVEVSLKNVNTSDFEKGSDALIKLNEDYQTGKISHQEYNIKLTENLHVMKNESENLTLFKIVESGYMLKTSGNTLDEPIPFNPSEDTWFMINE